MTEPADGLRALVDSPPSPPEPVEELRRRVIVRRRRRAAGRATLAVVAVVVAAVGISPLLDRAEDSTTQVVAGPDSVAPTTSTPTTIPLEFVAGQPIGTRIDFRVPAGWEVLFTQGDRMLASTRPLIEGDRALAVLARTDASFSAFPADAVVIVVGGDPVEAKYTTGPDGAMVAPGPAYGLGPEQSLPGGVRVRRGDIPQSIVKIASYAGPTAPAARLREAEAIAAGMQLVRTGDPSVRPSPPPPGSRAGLPGGPLPVAEKGLPEVARMAASGSSLVLVAGQDCAYLRWVDAQTTLPGYQPLAGTCGARPAGTTIQLVGQPVLVMRGPGSDPSTAVIFRYGTSVARVTARLADGRSVPTAAGADGWGVVASDGRVVALSGVDVGGAGVAEQPVG